MSRPDEPDRGSGGAASRAPAPGVAALLWRLSGATALMVGAFSMTTPLLAVLLQRAGHGTTTVGAFAMIPFLMVGLLIPVVPRAIARLGVVRTYRWGCGLNLAGALGYALGDGLAVWALCAAVSGAGAAALWNATEALLAREAPPERRGQVMGLYQTALGAAMALGPFAPALLGWAPRSLLWLGAALVAACCAVAASIPVHATTEPDAKDQSGTWAALKTVPVLAGISFTGGVFEAGLGAVSAAHAAASGMDLRLAASVAGAIGVGSFLCQYPAGLAADRFSARGIFSSAAALLLGASLLFLLSGRAPWLLWAVGMVWGGVGGALYTLTMVRVAHEFAGRSTAGGAAAMITGYTLGGMVGPVAAGAALQAGGTAGLAVGLSALAAACFAAARRLAGPV